LQALTQERRRYGFILERQCNLAKHILSYHSLGSAALQRNMDEWKEIAHSRDMLPESVEMTFANKLQVKIHLKRNSNMKSNELNRLVFN